MNSFRYWADSDEIRNRAQMMEIPVFFEKLAQKPYEPPQHILDTVDKYNEDFALLDTKIEDGISIHDTLSVLEELLTTDSFIPKTHRASPQYKAVKKLLKHLKTLTGDAHNIRLASRKLQHQKENELHEIQDTEAYIIDYLQRVHFQQWGHVASQMKSVREIYRQWHELHPTVNPVPQLRPENIEDIEGFTNNHISILDQYVKAIQRHYGMLQLNEHSKWMEGKFPDADGMLKSHEELSKEHKRYIKKEANFERHALLKRRKWQKEKPSFLRNLTSILAIHLQSEERNRLLDRLPVDTTEQKEETVTAYDTHGKPEVAWKKTTKVKVEYDAWEKVLPHITMPENFDFDMNLPCEDLEEAIAKLRKEQEQLKKQLKVAESIAAKELPIDELQHKYEVAGTRRNSSTIEGKTILFGRMQAARNALNETEASVLQRNIDLQKLTDELDEVRYERDIAVVVLEYILKTHPESLEEFKVHDHLSGALESLITTDEPSDTIQSAR